MSRYLLILSLTFAACSSDPTPSIGTTPDGATPDATTADSAHDPDGGAGVDQAGEDADVANNPDGSDDAGDSCATLTPAACMAEPSCTLRAGCVAASAADEPFEYFVSNNWDGTAESRGDKSFPPGETPAALTVFRSGPRDFRGVLILPELSVRHTVWGGVGPTGELGLYLGPPECPDPDVCNIPFAPAYEAGGLATDLTVELTDISANPAVIDFGTVVSVRLAPSDGFKPVFPVANRPDPIVATWMGDMVAVDAGGTLLDLYCEIEITATADVDPPGHQFRSFRCGTDEAELATTQVISSADSASINHANGVGWFAVGAEDDDLLFVGRVGAEGPWSGVIATRGGVWTTGDPIDPASVPLDSIVGVFTFHGLSPQR